MSNPKSVHHVTHSHVKGNTAYSRAASLQLETVAFFTDLGAAAALFFFSLKLFRLPLAPRFWWLLFVAALFGALWLTQRLWLERTLGEAVWRLRPKDFGKPSRGLQQSWKDLFLKRTGSTVYQSERMDFQTIVSGIFLTFLVWSLPSFLAYQLYAGNPTWQRAEIWKVSPFLPPLGRAEDSTLSASSTRWLIAPFFYSLGAWPRTFKGHPVFYTMPYEKGPPTRFLGHITARWLLPDVSLTFEGPRTPEQGYQREDIRECLMTPAASFRCLRIRETVLSRHVREMRAFLPTEWKLKWFVVENEALPPADQVQGIFLSGTSEARIQHRFIAITGRGAHQAFILNALNTLDGEDAGKVLEKAIGSLRVSDDLNPGRAWVDQQLEAVRLGDLGSPESTQSFEKLAEIQAMLIAKLSVDPKTYDTYYHLGGVAMLVARQAAKSRHPDWATLAKPLLKNIHRYATDVSPRENRNQQIQNLSLEAQKL